MTVPTQRCTSMLEYRISGPAERCTSSVRIRLE
jgi:hypothetical protein